MFIQLFLAYLNYVIDKSTTAQLFICFRRSHNHNDSSPFPLLKRQHVGVQGYLNFSFVLKNYQYLLMSNNIVIAINHS